jgi:osmoprotectant transport system ATP-binding protein
MDNSAAIELRGVHMSRGAVGSVLRGLDLSIAGGETVALVGRSGAGKSTILKLINGLLTADAGRVLVDGRDTRDWNAYELRRRIGYVLQDVGLFPHMTVATNVGVVPRLLGWDPARIDTRINEVLALVGLPASVFASRWPDELSGGQRQRVGVARALAADPPIMLMDEPFSAVDPIVRAQLQDEFLRLQGELGKTIVFVTHDIDEAIKLGNTICVLRVGGHLAQVGGPAALLSDPADDFVREFLGRDRGIRRLSFVPAKELPLGPAPAALDGEHGTFNPDRDSLRAALDAALLSPDGTAVAVDDDGRPVGTATQESIMAAAHG